MKKTGTHIRLEFIGRFRTKAREIPRHWSLSEVKGRLVIKKKYRKGLKDIKPGQRIAVIFYFHRSPVFSAKHLIQKSHHNPESKGVFSICSPFRPNPLGLSVLEVLEVQEHVISVKGIDMLDNTPILDIKPHIEK